MGPQPAALITEGQCMMREPTTRACFTLTCRQQRALQEQSRATGASAAELTRRALDAFLVGRVVGYVPGPVRPDPDVHQVGSASATTCS
jgi:hypothetical protein